MQQLTAAQRNNILSNGPLMGKDLCRLYGVTYYQLNKMLKEVAEPMGERNGYYFTPRQTIVFLNHFGYPPNAPEIENPEPTNS